MSSTNSFSLEEAEAVSSLLKQSAHPRLSEARLQLGKLQLVRAAQLMSGKPDAEKRQKARDSYTAASKTFDQIVDSLWAQL